MRTAAWAILAFLLIAIVLLAGRPTPLAQAIAVLAITILAGHAVLILGIVEATIFASICMAVSFTVENIGVSTGFPFGLYHFEVGAGLPMIGAIPVIVGPMYFGMGYSTWIIATLIANRGRVLPRSLPSLWLVPLIASVIMVLWDLVMDPPNATIARAWIWHDGGSYFGVPPSNFFGWFLTTYLYFQIIALVLVKRNASGKPDRPLPSPALLAVPVLIFLASALSYLPPLLDENVTVIDGAHRAWSSSAIREASAIVMAVTMLPTALFALFRLFDQRSKIVEARTEIIAPT